MHERSGVAGTRAPGGRVRVLVVLLVLTALVGLPWPARAATPGAPTVSAVDELVVWSGTTQTLAVRWHLREPATTVHWLVATPEPARTVPVDHRAFTSAAAEARPRDRWVVTHPWLLFGSDGERARVHLEEAGAPGPAAAPAVDDRPLPGISAALTAVEGAGAAADPATRAWVEDAVRRGWFVRLVTVTAPSPTTLVGPVALRFATTTPVVPSSPLPRGGRTTLLTVAPQVLAAEQPDPSAPADAADPAAASSDAALGADTGTATSTGPGAGPSDAPARAPEFTVENARTLPGAPAGLAELGVPDTGWVVTALDGRTSTATPTLLLPQAGSVADWRTQNGVWWPGWGAAALGVLALLVVGWLAVVANRRRARRPVVAAPPTEPEPAVPVEVDTLTDLRAVEDAGTVVDTRPDIRPVS